MSGNPVQNFWWFQAAKNKRLIETIARLEDESERLEAMADDLRLETETRMCVRARRLEIEELITELIGANRVG